MLLSISHVKGSVSVFLPAMMVHSLLVKSILRLLAKRRSSYVNLMAFLMSFLVRYFRSPKQSRSPLLCAVKK